MKVFGSKDAKKHSKHIHHKAIRSEGKHQDDLYDREYDWPRKSEKKQIDGLDVYFVKCPHCNKTFEGRFAYPSFVGADGRYCNSCPNLKIWIPDEDLDAPINCECGGAFDSYDLTCPSCRGIIDDAEKQLAVQFYVVEPSATPGEPSKKEIDDWYSARRLERFLTETELFVQLRRMLSRDEDTGDWKYFNIFEK